MLQNSAAVKSSLNSLTMIIAFCCLFFFFSAQWIFLGCISKNSLTEDTQAPSMPWVESGSDSADHVNEVFF